MRPHVCEVLEPREVALHDRDGALVVRVVHRVRLRHAHLDAVDHLVGSIRPIRAISSVASSTASSSGISQISSPSKQKYSTPRHVGPAHHVGAPGAEVLDAAGARARVVDVDPVVGERLRLVGHQRDEAEVAVAQLLGGLADGRRGRGIEAQDQIAERDGRQHAVDRSCSVRSPFDPTDDALDALAVTVPTADDALAQLHRHAELLDPLGEALPHLPRAEPRVPELLDQRRRRLAVEPEDREHPPAEREVLDPLRRPLRADLGAGIPHTFSVYERKNAS